MYCPNCRNLINDNSAFCPYCGAQQTAQYQYVQYQYVPVQQVQYQYIPNQQTQTYKSYSDRTNTLAIVGFILSFFFAFIGLICSIMGYRDAPRCGGNGKGLAIAGIIISVISMISAVIVFSVVFAAYSAMLA